MSIRWFFSCAVVFVAFQGACGGGQEPPNRPLQDVGTVVCPEGSVFDSARSLCVARELLPQPVATAPLLIDRQPELATLDAGVPNGDSGATVVVATSSPPARAGTVTVTCGFSNAWVSVMPVAKYPKDDSFVMQALIGFTQDPKFWNAEAEYAPIKPYAAKRCTQTPLAISVPAVGDYWLLVGEEGTFSTRHRYDRNGLKRKVTVTAAGAAFAISSADLVQTWLCISCPWFRTYDRNGAVATSFVILANRASPALSGTDRIAFTAPVVAGKIIARVLEREDEITSLDELVLVVRDQSGRTHTLLPRVGGARSALASTDGSLVELARGTEIVVEYELPAELADATVVSAVVVAAGHYDPK